MNTPLDIIKVAVLRGTLDDVNPLSMLRGNALVWTEIFKPIDDEWHERHIDRAPSNTAYKIIVKHSIFLPVSTGSTLVEFPEPQGFCINMMPFKLFQRHTLPENCRPYSAIINCCPIPCTDYQRVAYLTIHESIVPVGQVQRRPGLHIERPSGTGGGGRVCAHTTEYPSEYLDMCWGLGGYSQDKDGHPVDGIYMALTVADSCAVWPALIDKPGEVTDASGGIERMRGLLGEGRTLKAGELCWITDRTPHEALPVKAPAHDPGATHVHRSFFRLVVGPISVWHSKHNTPNPLGTLPDAPISDVDKFLVS